MVKSYMARIVFCAFVSFMLSVVPYYFDPELGRIIFVVVFAFSWLITKPVPERGESMNPKERRF